MTSIRQKGGCWDCLHFERRGVKGARGVQRPQGVEDPQGYAGRKDALTSEHGANE
jgi:hypothetical protein